MQKKRLRILFIGNSHTYVNDLPLMVAEMFCEEDYDCEVTMIAHGGWFLEQHVKEPDVRFNILYGHYDYVVLQEHAHPFGPEKKFFEAVRALNEWIRQAGAKPVIYMTWAAKAEPYNQERMTKAHEEIAREIGAIVAPVGKNWLRCAEEYKQVEMFAQDGQHASLYGSRFAAGQIFSVIRKDLEER